MTIAVVASGTQAASIGTEHSLATSTTGKTYVLAVNLQNLVNGDEVEIILYSKVLSGSTKQVVRRATFSNVPSEPNVYSEPIPANQYIEAALKQTAGTGRNFEWALLSLD